MEIKAGDIFQFSWKPEVRERDEQQWYRGHSSHCFDGQLVACEGSQGLRLIDTYWQWPTEPGWGNNGREFTPEEAERLGILTKVCNLEEVEEAKEREAGVLAPEDIFNVSYQHGCYKKWLKRKGAQRSQARMRETLLGKLEEARRKMRSAEWDEQYYGGLLQKVEQGELDSIYL